MTINEILSQVDSEKPNEYTTEQKLIWLNEAESAICVDLRGEVYDKPCHGQFAADGGSERS